MSELTTLTIVEILFICKNKIIIYVDVCIFIGNTHLKCCDIAGLRNETLSLSLLLINREYFK